MSIMLASWCSDAAPGFICSAATRRDASSLPLRTTFHAAAPDAAAERKAGASDLAEAAAKEVVDGVGQGVVGQEVEVRQAGAGVAAAAVAASKAADDCWCGGSVGSMCALD